MSKITEMHKTGESMSAQKLRYLELEKLVIIPLGASKVQASEELRLVIPLHVFSD